MPPSMVHGEINLGMGVVWRDGIDFGSATIHPFYKDQKGGTDRTIKKSEYMKGTWTYREVTESFDYARALYVNFGLNLAFIDFKAALSTATQQMVDRRVLIGTLELEEWSKAISPSSVNWSSEVSELNKIQSEPDEIQRFNWFTGKYGTHYISSVRSGFRLQFIATLKKSSSVSSSDLEAALRIWVFKADFESKYREAISNGELDITAVVICGSMQPKFSFIMRTFQEIDEFLSAMKRDSIAISLTVTGFKAKSYYGTLAGFPQIASIFNLPKLPTSTEALMLAFPKGTILAFDNSSPIPQGWGICDGIDGRPDLINRYIIGTATQGEARQTLDIKHFHSFSQWSSGINDTGGSVCPNCSDIVMGPNRRDHNHKVSGDTSSEFAYPPSTRFVFIIKL